jgi:hypothetical protein
MRSAEAAPEPYQKILFDGALIWNNSFIKPVSTEAIAALSAFVNAILDPKAPSWRDEKIKQARPIDAVPDAKDQ